jgi:heme oxygenase (biliverdin-IX-beta and delta-forming)
LNCRPSQTITAVTKSLPRDDVPSTMNRHAPSPGSSAAPPVPEPTYAERARTLAHQGRAGTLATVSRKHPGHPFASLMPYALDEQGRPLLLISSMAVHTQNLMADPRASLLVTQEAAGDPLAAGRLTLMGEGRPVPDPDRAGARATYLARHVNAAYWVDFDDFSFWRLEPADLYFVGGFAAMDWVSGAEYQAASPDPLADSAESILQHMNEDHAEALRTCARRFAGESADEATMVSVDRLGFKLRLRSGERVHTVRVPFPREVTTPGQCREVFIEMLAAAR